MSFLHIALLFIRNNFIWFYRDSKFNLKKEKKNFFINTSHVPKEH